METVRVIINHVDNHFEVTRGYLFDHENVMIFSDGCVWLAKTEQRENGVYEIVTPRSLLGEIKSDLNHEVYAEYLVKRLKRTSLYDYIVQKHFYSDQDIDFDVTGI